MKDNMETAVIMCILGAKFTSFYYAPKKYPAYCFTNNKSLQSELENKGWIYVYIDLPVSNDFVESTLQVKYVKFLQFEKEERFAAFSKFKYIIMTDHKQKLQDSHITQVLQKKKNKIFLKYHTDVFKSTSIWQEIERSMDQERYLRNMPQTFRYINEKIKQGYSEHTCIPWCGLILYEHNDTEVKKFTDEIYNDIMRVKMPNDQIVWAMVSQKYMDIIQMIPAHEIPVTWKLPVTINFKNIAKKTIKVLTPYGIIKLYLMIKKAHAMRANGRKI